MRSPEAALKRVAAARRFAASMPALAAEVDTKLHGMVAHQLARLPAGAVAARALIEQARVEAWVETMIKAKEKFEASLRGPGNRHDRRAARVKGTWQHAVRQKAEMYHETTITGDTP